MAFIQDVFIFIGRILLILFLLFTFIFAISESVSRSNEPNTKAFISPTLNKTLNDIVKNLNTDPLEGLSLIPSGNCQAGFEQVTFYRWQANKFCNCSNKLIVGDCPKSHTDSSGNVILGDDGGLLKNCKDTAPKDKHLKLWRGVNFCIKKMKNWKPITFNSTIKAWGCPEGYKKCNSTNICGVFSPEGHKCPMAELIKARDEVSLKQLKGIHPLKPHPYSLGGQFNDEKQKDMLFYLGEGAPTSQPFIGFQVGLQNLCLNTSLEEKWGESFPILKNPRAGCGTMGQFPQTLVVDRVDEIDFYSHNKVDKTLTSLQGYSDYIYGSQAILYGLKRFTLKQSSGCEKAHEIKSVEYDNDPGNLESLRNTSNTIIFIGIGVISLVLVIYLIVMKKPHAGFFIGYTLHIICMALAASQLGLGIMSFQNIKRMQNTNSVIYNIGQKECFEERKLNEIFQSFAGNLRAVYENHAFYADWSVVISVTYLISVLIYGLWLATSFKCSKELKVEEEDGEGEKDEKDDVKKAD